MVVLTIKSLPAYLLSSAAMALLTALEGRMSIVPILAAQMEQFD
jgi:hypothetical protein